jgi:hypothetical protein
MNLTLARIRALLTAAPTWITSAAAVVVILRDTIAEHFPGAADDVVAIATPVLAVLVAAHQIVRRVSPVLKAERGLLPPGGTPGDV